MHESLFDQPKSKVNRHFWYSNFFFFWDSLLYRVPKPNLDFFMALIYQEHRLNFCSFEISITNWSTADVFICDGLNHVWSLMFETKNSVFEFDYKKTNLFESVPCLKSYVRVFLMNDLVNLVKAFSMFNVHSFEANIQVFEFDH